MVDPIVDVHDASSSYPVVIHKELALFEVELQMLSPFGLLIEVEPSMHFY